MTDHPRHRSPYANVLETIAWTPLIRLSRVTAGITTPVYGKAEFFNPGGSVKDRIGLPMVERFEREGKLKPGGTIVEGTSGNTGVGLAIAAAPLVRLVARVAENAASVAAYDVCVACVRGARASV